MTTGKKGRMRGNGRMFLHMPQQKKATSLFKIMAARPGSKILR
jgi:hypothetical protein